MHDYTILLVGAGKMGGSILNGLLNATGVSSEDICIVDPFCKEGDFSGCQIFKNVNSVPSSYSFKIVLFAVKPQFIDNIVTEYCRFVSKSLFVSVIAGKTLDYFQRNLGEGTAVVRTMPNLPSSIGKGVTAGVANVNVSDVQKKNVRELFQSIGAFTWVNDESHMDVVTALSGSGPAYVFYFFECMMKFATECGLPEDVAFALASQTLLGSSEMITEKSKVEDVTTLRKNVTSPGGTTEAALGVLVGDQGLYEMVHCAMNEAKKRSESLKD